MKFIHSLEQGTAINFSSISSIFHPRFNVGGHCNLIIIEKEKGKRGKKKEKERNTLSSGIVLTHHRYFISESWNAAQRCRWCWYQGQRKDGRRCRHCNPYHALFH